MKENEKYYGIYLNNKVPRARDKENNYNKYNGSVKLKFEGKVYLLDDKDSKEELENNSKLKKTGKHTIEFINTKKEIYYIDIKIRKLRLICLFFIILLIGFNSIMFFANNEIKQYILNGFSSYEINLKGNKYVFDISYKDTDFKSIALTDNVSENNLIYPGSSGEFYILINTKDGNKDMIYNMQIQDEINKPKNLKFKTEGKIYNSMTELAKDINGTIKKDKSEVLKIEWFWEYVTDNNYMTDYIDTEDGMFTQNYSFLMRMIGQEKIMKGENNE